MTPEEQHNFEALKAAIAAQFRASFNIDIPIKDWKGEEIVMFQEDLFLKVKAKVSEKWFYTYIKNEAEKLPRIDILNLLSQYVGYQNWSQFKTERQHKKVKRKHIKLVYLLLFTAIPSLLLAYTFMYQNHKYRFCFYDDLKNEPITQSQLNIKVLKPDESPVYLTTGADGCFEFESAQKQIKFVVESPYYKTDTIVRLINTENKIIKLKADDYALMLNYYGSGAVKEWKNHRKKLEEIIADDAQIYQFYEGSNSIEIYTKSEFIQKLTIPTTSLKRMKILEKIEDNNQIVKLKFMVKSK